MEFQITDEQASVIILGIGIFIGFALGFLFGYGINKNNK